MDFARVPFRQWQEQRKVVVELTETVTEHLPRVAAKPRTRIRLLLARLDRLWGLEEPGGIEGK